MGLRDYPDWQRDGTDWPHRANSLFLDVNGLRWHVQSMGRKDAPVLLLLHGTGAGSHSWRDMMADLATGFRVIAPDLPGHAFTGYPGSDRMNLPDMAAAVADLLAHLDISPEVVAGHSAGAAIGARMILDHPELKAKKLVSFNGAWMPFGGEAVHLLSPIAKLMAANPVLPLFFSWRAGDLRAVRRLIEGTGSRLDDVGLKLYQRLMSKSGHCASALQMMANWDLEKLIWDVRRLDMPVLLVVGDRDKAVPPTDAVELAKKLPNAELVSQRGLGHLSHEERPDEAVKIILDTL